jgi:hypothetical protein
MTYSSTFRNAEKAISQNQISLAYKLMSLLEGDEYDIMFDELADASHDVLSKWLHKDWEINTSDCGGFLFVERPNGILKVDKLNLDIFDGGKLTSNVLLEMKALS